MNFKRNKKMIFVALLGGIYLILTLLFSFSSFSPLQLRVAEVLTILPTISFLGVWGVTFGCFFSNFIGFLIGRTMIWDAVFGTIATFIAAILSYKFKEIKIKGLPVLSSFMPVIINGIIIGSMLYFLTYEGSDLRVLLFYIFNISIGQIVPCMVLGLGLYNIFERTSLSKTLRDI